MGFENYIISELDRLKDKLIDEYKNLVYQKFSMSFIKEHKDLVNWDYISKL